MTIDISDSGLNAIGRSYREKSRAFVDMCDIRDEAIRQERARIALVLADAADDPALDAGVAGELRQLATTIRETDR